MILIRINKSISQSSQSNIRLQALFYLCSCNDEALYDNSAIDRVMRSAILQPIEQTLRRIQRDTPFFLSPRENEKWQPENITEIVLEVHGYGYTAQAQRTLLINSSHYLKHLIDTCFKVVTIEVTFNGFDLARNDEHNCFEAICNALGSKDRSQLVKKLHFHTSKLKGCNEGHFARIIRTINEVVYSKPCEDFSLRIVGWQFAKGLPDFNQFRRGLQSIWVGADKDKECVVFNLEISNMYMSAPEAYLMLEPIVSQFELLEQLKIDFSQYEPGLELERTWNEYIKGLRIKHRLESMGMEQWPYPVDSEEAKGNELLGLQRQLKQSFQEYTNRLVQIAVPSERQQIIEQRNKAQEDIKQKIKEAKKRVKLSHAQFLSRLKEHQNKISEHLIQSPFEKINKARAQALHRMLRQNLVQFISTLPDMKSFQIGFRNWNPMFDLATLKKTLEKESLEQQAQQLSRIRDKKLEDDQDVLRYRFTM